jgi:hypothetical protein
MPLLPASLRDEQQQQQPSAMEKLRTVFENHSFRTSVIHSLRSAISIYKDSCILHDADNEETTPSNQEHSDPCPFVNPKAFLLTMLGLHPNQTEMECTYDQLIKPSYILLLFCHKIRASLPKALESASVQALLRQYEHECRSMSNATPDSLQQLAVRVPE